MCRPIWIRLGFRREDVAWPTGCVRSAMARNKFRELFIVFSANSASFCWVNSAEMSFVTRATSEALFRHCSWFSSIFRIPESSLVRLIQSLMPVFRIRQSRCSLSTMRWDSSFLRGCGFVIFLATFCSNPFFSLFLSKHRDTADILVLRNAFRQFLALICLLECFNEFRLVKIKLQLPKLIRLKLIGADLAIFGAGKITIAIENIPTVKHLSLFELGTLLQSSMLCLEKSVVRWLLVFLEQKGIDEIPNSLQVALFLPGALLEAVASPLDAVVQLVSDPLLAYDFLNLPNYYKLALKQVSTLLKQCSLHPSQIIDKNSPNNWRGSPVIVKPGKQPGHRQSGKPQQSK